MLHRFAALSRPFALAAGLALAGCSRPAANPDAPADSAFRLPAAGEFSVMSFNLRQYRLQDRDEGPDPLSPRPRPEADALFDVIRKASPDVLAVQEMGDPDAWTDFKNRLRAAGLQYRYEEYLRADPNDSNLALLSRFPVVGRFPRTNDVYTIGPSQFPVRRGFLDVEIEVNPDYRFRLVAAHLKSKVFHAYGQAEMRRNEARLLGNHARALLNQNPDLNLLVLGDFNDVPDSRVLREIRTYQDKSILLDLRPADPSGDAWTRRAPNDVHERVDYLLASPAMAREILLDKTTVSRDPILLPATDHRPLFAVFSARDLPAGSAPDLSLRSPPDFPQND